MFAESIRQARRAIVAVVGGTLLVIAFIMIFTPGPASLVFPVALALLGTEFVWARRLIRRVKLKLGRLQHPKPKP